MSRIGQFRIEGPETTDKAACVLSDWFGKVAAGWADCAHDANGGPLAGKRRYGATALIKLGEPGGQRCRKTFFSGHLFQPRCQFAQGLCPAAGRVGKYRYTESHVPVILSQGDAGIDGYLPRRHRHIRGIGDKDGPLHQGAVRNGDL